MDMTGAARSPAGATTTRSTVRASGTCSTDSTSARTTSPDSAARGTTTTGGAAIPARDARHGVGTDLLRKDTPVLAASANVARSRFLLRQFFVAGPLAF